MKELWISNNNSPNAQTTTAGSGLRLRTPPGSTRWETGARWCGPQLLLPKDVRSELGGEKWGLLLHRHSRKVME